MQCAACDRELEAFTGDVCPHCQHFAHPTRLGIYDGLELIKRGGMGAVYRARHPELGTVVAIKTVHTHAGPAGLAERFEQEAKMAARIPHPGVVRVFDYDCQDGRLYLVMEMVDGETLRAVIEANDRTIAWRLGTVAQLADVLHAAHEQGIVHRDIKPENVMVDSTGRVRVLDFGISRVLEDGERLTQTGEILGTPEYIAPEQILDVPEAVDARTDVYSTGVVLYELLTGHSPFAGSNLFQVLKRVESLEPPPPSHLRQGIPREVDELVLSCIAKDKSARPADCRVLAARLRAAEGDGRRGFGQRGFSGGLLVAIALVCTVVGVVAGEWVRGDARIGDTGRQVDDSPASRIERLLRAPPPYDRYALMAASRAIPDGAPTGDLYWRGMARKQAGALFLALRDFERARDAGHARARVEAAIVWVYVHRLLPEMAKLDLLRGPSEIVIEGDGGWARAVEAFARGAVEDVPAILSALEPPPAHRRADLGILAALAGGGTAPVPELAKTGYLPARMLDARGGDVERIERLLRDVDRAAPMRYFLEAAAAIRGKDEPRLRAALELAAVAGEANYAIAMRVASRLANQRPLNDADEHYLKAMARDLSGPAAPALRKAIEERVK